MVIPVSRIRAASLTRAPQQASSGAAESSVFSFPETLAAVAAAIEDQARRIRQKYGLTVRITAVSPHGGNSGQTARTGPEGPGIQRELVIAPNILQQMSKDPVLQHRIYGYLDEYVRREYITGYPGLVVHRDGTCTFPSADSLAEAGQGRGQLMAGPPDMQSRSHAQDRLQQLAFLRARRSGRPL
ncbi:hypothetical protein MHI24_14995 [Paenibacillus sp. FSL K6-1096]|uniref:hypothetical protein n=1 Tax=Paenibacillus sp. FSL K6-1096 TaxID=2921460 RepID=UPI0030EC5D1A